ncbi:MAG: signal peptidase II [Eggerthellaceae bacterium]|nr:signal peptidase II [Eggerthellaceae bacterium]
MSIDTAVSTSSRARSYPYAGLFIVVIIVWLAFDFLTKRLIVNGGYALGEVFGGPYLGIFDFRLVHNTGAAWGIFGDSTMALAIFSIVVCLALIIFVFTIFRTDPAPIHFGFALVVAGGIGNIIDRLSYGYVIDFIETTFIDFPVFNIADIGVTCGFAIVIVSLIYYLRHKRCGYVSEIADSASAEKLISRADFEADHAEALVEKTDEKIEELKASRGKHAKIPENVEKEVIGDD